MRFQDRLSFWVLVAVAFYMLFYSCARPLWFLSVARTNPPTRRDASLRSPARLFAWLSHREWYVVFAVANAAVFWLSMTSVAGWHFPETLVENGLVTLQLSMMGVAVQRVVLRPAKIHRRVVLDFNAGTRNRWIWSTSLGLAANILALTDSILQFLAGDVGRTKFWIWVWMDGCAMLFFGVVLFLVLNRLYEAAKSPWLALLWLDIGALVWLTTLDMTTPGR
jgi:hypothetical protein